MQRSCQLQTIKFWSWKPQGWQHRLVLLLLTFKLSTSPLDFYLFIYPFTNWDIYFSVGCTVLPLTQHPLSTICLSFILFTRRVSLDLNGLHLRELVHFLYESTDSHLSLFCHICIWTFSSKGKNSVTISCEANWKWLAVRVWRHGCFQD